TNLPWACTLAPAPFIMPRPRFMCSLRRFMCSPVLLPRFMCSPAQPLYTRNRFPCSRQPSRLSTCVPGPRLCQNLQSLFQLSPDRSRVRLIETGSFFFRQIEPGGRLATGLLVFFPAYHISFIFHSGLIGL